MYKKYITKLIIKDYVEKVNEEIQYDFKKLVEKKEYLEEKGYYLPFGIVLENDDGIDMDIDGFYEEIDSVKFFILKIYPDEDCFTKARINYQNGKSYNYDKLGKKSWFYKQFNFEEAYFYHMEGGYNYFVVDLEHNEVIINYIEKCYEMEKLKEKLPLKNNKEGVKKI